MILWLFLLTFSQCFATSAFGCNNNQMTDEIRSQFLNFHKEIRQKIANGKAQVDNITLPKGKNIYSLNWDCELEEAVAKHMSTQKCPNPAYGKFPDFGFIGQSLTIVSVKPNDPADITKQIDAGLKSFWTLKGASLNNMTFNNQPASFAQIAKAAATAIGCVRHLCTNSMSIYCLYDKAANYKGSQIYEIGEPCKSHEECTTYPDSKCSNGICSRIPIGPDDGNNTICKNSPSMTDAVRNRFLHVHNDLRSRLARGLMDDGPNGRAPKARRMLKLRYDCKLEESAQKLASQCDNKHSGFNGENLFRTSAKRKNKQFVAEESSLSWWSDISKGVGGRNIYTDDVHNRGLYRYTVMAWDSNQRIGCGIAECPTGTQLFCHYKPGGNKRGMHIYQMGEPCSACPKGCGCDASGGLCENCKDRPERNRTAMLPPAPARHEQLDQGYEDSPPEEAPSSTNRLLGLLPIILLFVGYENFS